MKKIFLLSLCLLILLQFNLAYTASFEVPEPNALFYVYDEANIMDQESEEYIIKTNEELYKRTGAQIVVVSLNSLENNDIRRYANEIFEVWEIGSKEYDNGLLMLIAPNEGEMWIEVGYGLEGPLPDSKVGNIMESTIFPYFRENDFSKGIISGFNEIIDEVEKEYNIELDRDKINEDMYYSRVSEVEENRFSGVKGILTAIGIIIFLFIDYKFFHGFFTYNLLLRGRRHGRGSSRGNRGGGGRSGGGGAGGRW